MLNAKLLVQTVNIKSSEGEWSHSIGVIEKDLLEVVRLTGPLGNSINGNKWGGEKWEKEKY